jgi:putative methanogen marker protein 4
MDLLNTIRKIAKDRIIKVGIGIGKTRSQYRTIIEGIINYLTYNQAEIFLFGMDIEKQDFLNEEINTRSRFKLNFVNSQKPESEMIDYLLNHKLDAIIRGGLSSNKFLEYLKKSLNMDEINRLALLETVNGHQFFFGPVGIDECNEYDAKITFLNGALSFIYSFNITPKVSILSGGRNSDLGRDMIVDKTIKESEKIVKYFKAQFPNLVITHDEILIEKAISNKSNLILAPNGISGNLIYRTLVHLGGGKAYGAIYLGLNHVIIDTSRVGKSTEIEGALTLANFLHSQMKT